MVIWSAMSDEKRKFKVVINHREYHFVGVGTPDKIARVEKALNQQLDEIKQQSALISSEDAAVVLAFNLLSEKMTRQASQNQRHKNFKTR